MKTSFNFKVVTIILGVVVALMVLVTIWFAQSGEMTSTAGQSPSIPEIPLSLKKLGQVALKMLL